MAVTIWYGNVGAEHRSLPLINIHAEIMKYLLALTLFACAALVQAGTVNLLPMEPTAGGSLTIEYKPAEAQRHWIDARLPLHAVVMSFAETADVPTAEDVPLKFDGKRFVGEYTVPQGVVYLMIKVGTGKEYDDNREQLWSAIIHTPEGKAVRGGYMKAAQTYLGSLPPECRRKQDLEEAAMLLNQETMRHQRNIAARINQLMLESSLGVIPQEDAQAELRSLLTPTLRPETPDDALSMSAAYRSLNQESEAARVLHEAQNQFPNSKVVEQISFEELSKVKNLDDFVNRAIEHLARFPQSTARASLITNVVEATTRQGAFPALIRFLDGVQHLPASTYYLATNYIGAQDTLRSEAMRMIEKGLKAADDPLARYQFIGQSEWNAEQAIARSQIYFVKGAILRHEGKNTEAISALESSVQHGGAETDKAVFDMLVSLLASANNDAAVITYAEQAMKSGANTPNLEAAYRSVLARKGKDSAQVESQVASMKQSGQLAMLARISREMLNQPLVDGTFTSLTGQPVKISDWKGKVVVLDYWATWCGPCRKSFPSLQKLYEKYKDNPNVQFAVVNVWERDSNRVQLVQDFLAKNPTLTFPMFFDQKDEVVSKYGVTGIPTKFFLGKDGRIQFKEVGLLPDEQFIEEASKKIDVLLTQ